MFELDRSFASINLASKQTIVLRLVKGCADRLVGKHKKIIRDDKVELVVGPVASLA